MTETNQISLLKKTERQRNQLHKFTAKVRNVLQRHDLRPQSHIFCYHVIMLIIQIMLELKTAYIVPAFMTIRTVWGSNPQV